MILISHKKIYFFLQLASPFYNKWQTYDEQKPSSSREGFHSSYGRYFFRPASNSYLRACIGRQALFTALKKALLFAQGFLCIFISSFRARYNNPIDTSETKDSPFKSLPYNFLTVFGNFMEM